MSQAIQEYRLVERADPEIQVLAATALDPDIQVAQEAAAQAAGASRGKNQILTLAVWAAGATLFLRFALRMSWVSSIALGAGGVIGFIYYNLATWKD